MEQLLAYAVELVKDSAVAERIVREASTKSSDAAERRRLVTEAAEAHKRAEAARRVETWKAFRPKAALIGLPVVAAFAIGLVTGTTAGMVKLPQASDVPDTLVPGGPALITPFETERTFKVDLSGAGQVVLLLELMNTGVVSLDVNGRAMGVVGAEVVVPPSALVRGVNTLHFRGAGGGFRSRT